VSVQCGTVIGLCKEYSPQCRIRLLFLFVQYTVYSETVIFVFTEQSETNLLCAQFRVRLLLVFTMQSETVIGVCT